jgi:hypothetical protein
VKLAIVTMVYNEPDMLPQWLQHYAPEGDMFVIDHGSDDGSTALHMLGANANRVRIPRSAHDNRKRADFVQDFTTGLLRYYDAVLFTDVDELVVADPAEYGSLREYVARPGAPPVEVAIGLNVIHRLHHEPAALAGWPILQQRRYCLPSASMWKPVLIREPVRWSNGFHCCGQRGTVGAGLFLFHIAYADLQTALRRQAKRQIVEGASLHHLANGSAVHRWIEGWSSLPIEEPSLDSNCAILRDFAFRLIESQTAQLPGAPYKFDLSIWGDHLWRIPERFLTA